MARKNLSQSGLAIRRGLADPTNVDDSPVQLGMDRPGKSDYANSGDSDPWRYLGQGGDQKYDVGRKG